MNARNGGSFRMLPVWLTLALLPWALAAGSDLSPGTERADMTLGLLNAFSLPLLTVDGMPLGVQLIGRANTDGQLAATAGWLTNKLQQGLSKRGS